MKTPACPTPEQLEHLLDEQLEPAELQRVSGHVADCLSCQRLLETMTADSYSDLPSRRPPPADDPDTLARDLLERIEQSPPFSTQHLAKLPRSEEPSRQGTDGGRVAAYPSLGDYEVLGVLGRGGEGVVYKACHRPLDRIVALKMLRDDERAAPLALARFRREAETLARLQHPNIVQVFEIGVREGQPFFAMEFVAGGTLAGRLQGQPQAARESAALLAAVARAVHAAHEAGIVHRDLKPANILLLSANGGLGVPKIGDFGLARRVQVDSGLTRTGMVLGTPGYMAPEQARGEGQELGPACDVYALGSILYHLLTGRAPFVGDSAMQILLQVVHADPVAPRQLFPQVPRDLETICLKCIQKEPHKRYTRASELADDLERFLAGQPIRARPTSAGERAVKWACRRPAVAALSATVLLVAFTGLALVLWQWSRAEDKAREEIAARTTAENRRRHSEEVEARLALRQGQALCEQGDVGRGVLWLARGLERADNAGALALDRPLRVNLATWSQLLPTPPLRLPNPAPVLSLAFDPAGRQLFVGGKDGEVHVWDLATQRLLGTALKPPWHKPGNWVGVVRVSPDGRLVAVAGHAAVTLWDAATHQPLGKPLPHSDGMVWGLAFFPDGKRLASLSDDGSAWIWDLATQQVIAGPLRHTMTRRLGFGTSALSPDGRTLVTAGEDRRAIFWDVATREATLPQLWHESTVMAAVFTRDGRKLITSTRAGTIHIWDLKTGQAVNLPNQGIETDALALSPDGRYFASGSHFGIVQLWRTDTLRPVGSTYRCEGGVDALAFSPDGRRLAMGMDPGAVAITDLPPFPEAVPTASLDQGIQTIHYSADGSRILAGTSYGTRWIETATGICDNQFLANPENMLVNYSALSPDGAWIAMGRWSGIAGQWRGVTECWDAATGQRRWQTPDQPTPTTLVAFSPDSRRLFCCGRTDEPGGGGLWDVATGHCIRPLLRPLGLIRVRRAVFHPSGALLLLACEDGRARLWNVNTDTEIDPERPLVHASAVTAAIFDADGERLLTGCRDGTAWLWSTQTRRLLLPPMRHEMEVSAVAFSPDGRTLLTGSLSGAARLWDAASGQALGPTLWQDDPVYAVAFHPNRPRLAVGGAGGKLNQWPVVLPTLDGSAERIRLWAEISSGLTLDDQGAERELPPGDLAERRQRLEKGDQ